MQWYFETVINLLSEIGHPLALLSIGQFPTVLSHQILMSNESTTAAFPIFMYAMFIIALIFMQIFFASSNNFIDSLHQSVNTGDAEPQLFVHDGLFRGWELLHYCYIFNIKFVLIKRSRCIPELHYG